MQFFGIISILTIVCAFSLVNGFATSSSYDNTYDKGSNSLDIVACSNGANGLRTKGFTTFNSLPTFPFIGGAPAVTGWNSPNCGTCWALTYKGKTINVLAIDVGSKGFNIAQKALDVLTNGRAVELGRVDVTATQIAASKCGL